MTRCWTAEDMPDLSGQLVVVTGASSGLGFECSRAFGSKGALVVMAGRSKERTGAAAAAIRNLIPSATLKVSHLDLADLSSVRLFAREITQEHGKLDILVNNAGVMAVAKGSTVDGFETHFGTNHLGHFALTGLLLPSLQQANSARIVTVSSIEHRKAHGVIAPSAQRDYQLRIAYQESKLANVVFAIELARRLAAANSPVISVAAHPGYSATNLSTNVASLLMRIVLGIGNKVIAQSPRQGALPQLYAATASSVAPGDYFGPGGLGQLRGCPTKVRAIGFAYDEYLGRSLWTTSENLAKVQYP